MSKIPGLVAALAIGSDEAKQSEIIATESKDFVTFLINIPLSDILPQLIHSRCVKTRTLSKVSTLRRLSLHPAD